jgi:hypothetical protein
MYTLLQLVLRKRHRAHPLTNILSRRGSSGESAITATGEIPEGNAPRKRRKLADDEVSKVELERQLAYENTPAQLTILRTEEPEPTGLLRMRTPSDWLT